MILTCPECAASYFADDASIGAGRKVRCASCGNVWRAMPEADELEEADEAVAEPEPDVSAAVSPPADDELFEAPIAEAVAETPLEQAADVGRSEQRRREASSPALLWAGLGASIALLLVVGTVFRVDIVQLWPKTASLYAGVGLPVNGVGLTIEKVHGQPSVLDGRSALVVSGEMRNLRSRTLIAPPISIALLDHSGRRLLVKTISADDRIVPPGQTRDFKVSLLNPPAGAESVDVTFAPSPPAHLAPPAIPPTSGSPPIATSAR